MTTATEVAVRCNQCFKEFTAATEQAAIRSFKGHATRTGHVNQYTIVEDTDVANETAEAEAKQTAKDRKAAEVAARKAEREAKRAEKAAAEAKAKEERAAAREAAKAERNAPRTTPCECGCGGIPAGRKSRFLPGHDAKHYSAIRQENGVKDEAKAK